MDQESEEEFIQEPEIVQKSKEEPVIDPNLKEKKINDSRHINKKRRSLSRSLVGMIEDEQNVRLNRGKDVARYFGEGKIAPKKTSHPIHQSRVTNKPNIQT